MHWMRDVVAPADRAGDRAREDRLGGARDVLEENVAAAGERGDHELDPVPLAVHDGLDIGEERLGRAHRRLEPGGGAPRHRAILGAASRQAVRSQGRGCSARARRPGSDDQQAGRKRSGTS